MPEIRDTLFGDMPIEAWPPKPVDAEPWSSFMKAREAIAAGDHKSAIELLSPIAASAELESRHVLQAWHFLRELGVEPPPELARRVLGVVVEVGTPKGVNLVAGYADKSCRVYDPSGAGVVWERQDDAGVFKCLVALLKAGNAVVDQIGLWDGPRPPAPGVHEARINMLTPQGLCFGQAEIKVLSAERLGGPVMAAALDLANALVAKAK